MRTSHEIKSAIAFTQKCSSTSGVDKFKVTLDRGGVEDWREGWEAFGPCTHRVKGYARIRMCSVGRGGWTEMQSGWVTAIWRKTA